MPAPFFRGHFVERYKDLEPDKWTRIGDWIDAAGAEQLIVDGIARARAARR